MPGNNDNDNTGHQPAKGTKSSPPSPPLGPKRPALRKKSADNPKDKVRIPSSPSLGNTGRVEPKRAPTPIAGSSSQDLTAHHLSAGSRTGSNSSVTSEPDPRSAYLKQQQENFKIMDENWYLLPSTFHVSASGLQNGLSNAAIENQIADNLEESKKLFKKVLESSNLSLDSKNFNADYMGLIEAIEHRINELEKGNLYWERRRIVATEKNAPAAQYKANIEGNMDELEDMKLLSKTLISNYYSSLSRQQLLDIRKKQEQKIKDLTDSLKASTALSMIGTQSNKDMHLRDTANIAQQYNRTKEALELAGKALNKIQNDSSQPVPNTTILQENRKTNAKKGTAHPPQKPAALAQNPNNRLTGYPNGATRDEADKLQKLREQRAFFLNTEPNRTLPTSLAESINIHENRVLALLNQSYANMKTEDLREIFNQNSKAQNHEADHQIAISKQIQALNKRIKNLKGEQDEAIHLNHLSALMQLQQAYSLSEAKLYGHRDILRLLDTIIKSRIASNNQKPGQTKPTSSQTTHPVQPKAPSQKTVASNQMVKKSDEKTAIKALEPKTKQLTFSTLKAAAPAPALTAKQDRSIENDQRTTLHAISWGKAQADFRERFGEKNINVVDENIFEITKHRIRVQNIPIIKIEAKSPSPSENTFAEMAKSVQIFSISQPNLELQLNDFSPQQAITFMTNIRLDDISLGRPKLFMKEDLHSKVTLLANGGNQAAAHALKIYDEIRRPAPINQHKPRPRT